jgi:predicted Ser/Thr protein kinase
MRKLYEADFDDANFNGTKINATGLGDMLFRLEIKFEQNFEYLTCKQLKRAENWQSAYRDNSLACGAKIPVKKTKY